MSGVVGVARVRRLCGEVLLRGPLRTAGMRVRWGDFYYGYALHCVEIGECVRCNKGGLARLVHSLMQWLFTKM